MSGDNPCLGLCDLQDDLCLGCGRDLSAPPRPAAASPTTPGTVGDAACYQTTGGQLQDCGVPLASGTMSSAQILLGQSSGAPQWKTMSGGCTITSAGVVSCSGLVSSVLTSAHLFVGNASNVATDVLPTVFAPDAVMPMVCALCTGTEMPNPRLFAPTLAAP